MKTQIFPNSGKLKASDRYVHASALRRRLRRLGLSRGKLAWLPSRVFAERWFLKTVFTTDRRRRLVATGDPVRYGALLLALDQIVNDELPGAFAECGVYRGDLSRFISEQAPWRKFYLFDTFQGFDGRDSDSEDDLRFRDTSEHIVRENIGSEGDLIIRKGYFPETAEGLDDEQFAFTMIDFDKYEPTKAALEFFYPRTTPGGFILVHDYTNPESDWACSRALNEFLADKPEHPILLPDAWGTALFRKV